MSDRVVWKLHLSHKYKVKSAYSYLTAVDTNSTEDLHNFLWLKAVPLKVNIFFWHLFLNRLVKKDNLRKRNVLDVSLESCATSCEELEDMDHFF